MPGDGSTEAMDFGGMFMDLEPLDSMMMETGVPALTAETSDWVFQGVDTTYWSLLNGGGNFGT